MVVERNPSRYNNHHVHKMNRKTEKLKTKQQLKKREREKKRQNKKTFDKITQLMREELSVRLVMNLNWLDRHIRIITAKFFSSSSSFFYFFVICYCCCHQIRHINASHIHSNTSLSQLCTYHSPFVVFVLMRFGILRIKLSESFHRNREIWNS